MNQNQRFVLFGKRTWVFDLTELGGGWPMGAGELERAPEEVLQTMMARTAEEVLQWARRQEGWLPTRAVPLAEVTPEQAYQIGHDEGFDEGVSK